MNADDVQALLAKGENSRVEFKSDAVSNEELAIVMVSFLNSQGGVILLGVEDNAAVSGISGSTDKRMNAVHQICQNRVRPPVIPEINAIPVQGKTVLAVSLEKGVQKPYYIVKNEKTLYYIRSGATCRLATPEQIAILYANHPAIHYDASPSPEADLDHLDQRRIRQYFTEIKHLTQKQYAERRISLCIASRIAANIDEHRAVATTAGVLLFAQEPSRFVASAGVRCAAFAGERKDYDMTDHRFLDGPLTPYTSGGATIEYGLIDRALQFVESHIRTPSRMEGIRRISEPEYPIETLREAVTNALVHRDYALLGGQIQLLVFSDRIEIRSPGRLPNTLTMEMVQTGASFARNPVLMKFVENYGYVEHLGLGVPEKIIRPMLDRGYPHPEFIDNGYEFVLILRKSFNTASTGTRSPVDPSTAVSPSATAASV